jgi:hypothetical protein
MPACKLIKPALLLLCLSLLLTAAPALAGDYCRRVRISGTINLTPINYEDHIGPRRGLLICKGTGEYSIEMIFPADGGEPLKQQNFMKMSEFECLPFGTARPCVTTPYPDACEPVPFTLKATLRPESAAFQGDIKWQDKYWDEIDFRIAQLPPLKPFMVTYECGGAPADRSDYGVTYSQLFQVLYQTKWSLMAPLNKPHSSTASHETLHDKFQVEIVFNTFITYVPCKNFLE